MSDFEFAQPPADGTPAPDTDAPSSVEVAIGGKTYRVPADMAASLDSERTAAPAQQPQTVGLAQPPDTQTGLSPADDDQFWTDPQAFINQKIQEGLSQGFQQQNQHQQAQQAESQFWDGFYQKNPHLKQIESYVTHLATQNVNQLKQFNGDQVKIANYIADLGNKELHKFGKTPNTSEVFVEGTAQPTPQVTTPPQKPDNVTTMGDVLRKRRENRRKARLGA